MPRIVLKHKSPEYADDTQAQSIPHVCEMPGCLEQGSHKAPKHRGLNEHYRFCLNHVQEYNKAWDFFTSMPAHEVEAYMTNSIYGDRPTWKSSTVNAQETLYKAARNFYHYDNEETQNTNRKLHENTNTPEYEAMAVMGLSPPVTLEEIKTTYKKLAKKYHPDLNNNDQEAEELLKTINMAYTILKLAFSEYEKLIDKES